MRFNLFYLKKQAMPYVELGGFYSLMVKANETINSEVIPINMYYKTINYGLLGGIGYMHYVKNFGFGINARYYYNLRNNNDASNRYLSTQMSNNLMYKYYQLTDDVRISSLSLSFMLVYNLRYSVF